MKQSKCLEPPEVDRHQELDPKIVLEDGVLPSMHVLQIVLVMQIVRQQEVTITTEPS